MPTTATRRPRRTAPLLARPANKKLGEGVFSWSLPVVRTCPGRTEACVAICYARRGRMAMAPCTSRYDKNLEISRRDDFAGRMARSVEAYLARAVRVHVSGDFYSAEYAAKWAEVARACPDTRFWAYTRSWRRPAILAELLVLGALPNFELWWSEDRDTGPSPDAEGVRRAVLVATPEDEALAAGRDLDFRDRAHVRDAGRVRRVGGVPVCPHEVGLPDPPTCSACRICWTPPRTRETSP